MKEDAVNMTHKEKSAFHIFIVTPQRSCLFEKLLLDHVLALQRCIEHNAYVVLDYSRIDR